jgi:vancomycin resistance protein YoaR
MAVNISNIIPAKTAEASQTTQYTSSGVQTIIDKFTATNYSASAATISVNLVTAAGSAGNDNLIVKTKTLQPAETYTFPELVGHVLPNNGFISTIAGTGSAINIRASGRLVS